MVTVLVAEKKQELNFFNCPKQSPQLDPTLHHLYSCPQHNDLDVTFIVLPHHRYCILYVRPIHPNIYIYMNDMLHYAENHKTRMKLS